MDHELVVLSPEKTILTYRLSGLGSRVLAHILDLFILAGMMYFLAFKDDKEHIRRHRAAARPAGAVTDEILGATGE